MEYSLLCYIFRYKDLSWLQQLALDNKLSPADISGGIITLSNIGAIGGKFGAPILNLPDVAIIAMGRIQKLPKLADDRNVYPASIMTVSCNLHIFFSFIQQFIVALVYLSYA